MFRFILFALVIVTANAAPTLPPAAGDGTSEISAASSKPTIVHDHFSPSAASTSTSPIARPPISIAKALSTISEIRTPASTMKMHLILEPLSSLYPSVISPYAYAVPAPGAVELAAPSTYSIEQHGYRIIY